MWLAWTPATYPFNLTGQPALSLPVGLTPSGLPVGLQLVGPFGGDELVLSAARRIEADLGARPALPIESQKG
jgi:aspartyl-tRNA(Asn)/glutamyl-tRNA(Gln) amidotransferase subunit A